jgi:phage protein U
MAWTYNSIKIFTQSLPKSAKQIIARLQPIDSGTTLQFFGYEDPIIKLSGIVVGDSDIASLHACVQTGTAYALKDSADSTVGSYYLASINTSQRLGIISQTIRQDLSCDSPVYDVELELYE